MCLYFDQKGLFESTKSLFTQISDTEHLFDKKSLARLVSNSEVSDAEMMYDESLYKQVYSSQAEVTDDNYDNTVPNLICFLQAYFLLLLSTCKSLNETIDILSNLPQPRSPRPLQSYPVQPTAPSPSPQCPCEAQSRPRSCCEVATAISWSVEWTQVVTSCAKVWMQSLSDSTREGFRNLKENAVIYIASFKLQVLLLLLPGDPIEQAIEWL
jgi:hypothetical protein